MLKFFPLLGVLALWFVGTLAVAEEAAPESITGKAVCQMDGCQGGCCIAKLEDAVKGVKGVKSAKVDRKANTMTIETEAGAKVALSDVRAAIAKADSKHNHGFKLIAVQKPQKGAK